MNTDLKYTRKPNPRENANPLSIFTFFYTFKTFCHGWRREFNEEDLYETLREHQSDLLGNKIEAKWDQEVKNAKKAKRKPSLRRVLIKTFGLSYLRLGFLLAFVDIGIKLGQPLALGGLISYFSKENKISTFDACLYAGGVVGSSLGYVLFNHPYMFGAMHIGMKAALEQTTVGQVVNLLSNDVMRFDMVTVFMHYVWTGLLQTTAITYIMYRYVKFSAVIGVVFILFFIPLQLLLGKLSSIFRLKTALRTDERIRLMNEMILGIQVIKMYTWEKPLAKLIATARKKEINAVRAASYVVGIYLSFIMFVTRTALFVTVLAYVLFGNNIRAEQVFILICYYDILRTSMAVFFPRGIALTAETLVTVKRLNEFLLHEEQQEQQPVDTNIAKGTDNSVTIRNATAKWVQSSAANTFTNVNLSIKRGTLVVVIGPVGSGKTSLLYAILRELPLITGSVHINGKISYASQEPWLFTGSVRQNIVFGQEMNRERYTQVVNKCALERDFVLLPYSDKTIVGERGISLSGGQRARINLARAVYKEADIYLLDDPLSAVDTHVGKELFDNCVKEYLSQKTVILITHQLQYLQDVDHIVILDNGVIKAEGTFTELQSSGLNFAKLLKSESQNQELIAKPEPTQVSVQLFMSSDLNFAKLLKSESANKQELIDKPGPSVRSSNVPTQVEEQRSTGSVSCYVYKSYVKAGGNACVILILVFLLIIAQVAASLTDYFITYWVNLEQRRDERNQNHLHFDDNFWEFSTEMSIYIYSGLTAALIVLTLIRSFTFYAVCMNASINLHNKMFNSLIRAVMRFFNTNSSGRILNRFSKDIGLIDEQLPHVLIDCIQIGLAFLGIITVVIIVNPIFLAPTIVIGIVFYSVRRFYMATSRIVKRLEGVTRSPVFAHLNASLQGLVTIRAFDAQATLIKEFDNHLDLHSSTWFMFISTSQAFGYWMDLTCVLYIAIVTFSFIVFENEKLGGNVGLAITQVLALTGMFQWGMRQSGELENQMTSVERVLEYTQLESERPLETAPDKKPSKTWPENGEIKFVKVSLQYFPGDPPILKNLNFTIRPLEKVGIVGRTGAGKSSLISALFQLTETEGSILIDDIDITYLGLHDLRSKISIIPQEPVLFSGTMRKNLDPFDEFTDETLWKALEEVELKEAVIDMASGLNSQISEGGTNFSVGQRQLVCLARAIIRNNKILVLDEATANVDPQTDALIQQTIRQKFNKCTVLTIAHRLNTIMDSDRVLVMDAGMMVEFDHPSILLENKNGIFYSMVQQTGKVMAENLIKIAKENYNKKPSKQTKKL